MTSRRFKQVDVFTAIALRGNPVAVVLDGDGLSDADMQAFASWTNLSETTFVLTPTDREADYAVRIFTPRSELPFAGHPTLGTAHAVIEAGMARPRDGLMRQQCKAGLISVATGNDHQLSLRMPAHSVAAAPEPGRLMAALNIKSFASGAPQIVTVGPAWVIAELDSAATVAALAPDLAALAAYDRDHATTGITLFARRDTDSADIIVRSFAPADGIAEDPVCGSGNGAVAAYRLAVAAIDRSTSYTAWQGAQVGRDGRVQVRIDDGVIHIGGHCLTCIDGTVRL